MIGAIILKVIMGSGTNVMNERDVDKILEHWHDDAVMIYPGETVVSGKTEGKEALREFFSCFMDQFPEMDFSIDETYIRNMFALGFSNTIASEFSVRYTNRHGESFENRGVTVIEIKKGKVKQIRDYYFDVDKLNRAWRQS